MCWCVGKYQDRSTGQTGAESAPWQRVSVTESVSCDVHIDIHLVTCRSHDRRSAPKAVKFSNTVTEYPHYDENGWSSGGVVTKPVQSHKYSPSHTVNHVVNSPTHSSAHSVGQHADRIIPDGEMGLVKLKSSNDKQ